MLHCTRSNIVFFLVLLVLSFIINNCKKPGSEATGSNNTTYRVTVNPAPNGTGIIKPSSDSVYNKGQEISLLASPEAEYLFESWTGDISSTDNPYRLTVDRDYSLTANFALREYKLALTTSGEGMVSEQVVQKKQTDYEYGTVVELTANPAEEWKFKEWQEDLEGNENPATITVDSEKVITAVFELISKPVASIDIQEENMTLRVGDEQQLHAVVRDADYNRLLDRVVEWTSLNPEYATVDDAGFVTTVSPGMATITASSEGQDDEISILVEESDASLYVQALIELQKSVLNAVEHSGMWWVYSVDVEGDGYQDVVVQHGKDEDGVLTKYSLLLYRNINNTSFEKVDTGIPAFGRVVVSGDFNGDNLDDLFFADHGEESTEDWSQRTIGTNQLLVQDGSGGFVETTSTALPDTLLYSHGACAGDVNRDGALDIVVIERSQMVLINNGSGNFTESVGFITPDLTEIGETSEPEAISISAWACGAGDFRNQGGDDIILSSDGYETPADYGDGYPNPYQGVDPFGNSLPQSAKLLFSNQGTELEYRYPESVIESPWAGSGTAAVGLNTLTYDFNRDGCLDFSVYSTDYVNMHKAEVYLGNCAGGFSEPQVFTLPAIDFLWEDIELADVDGDGWMDIVMSNSLADDWIWGGGNRSDLHVVLENTGGNFSLREGQPSDAVSIPPSVAVSWILE